MSLKLKTKIGVIVFFLFLAVVPGYAAGEETRVITIPEGMGMVLRDSRLIKVAVPDKELAMQNSLIARSALLPHINATVSEIFNGSQPAAKFGSQSVPTAEKNSYSYGFDVYQTLFDFGKALADYRASKELVKASEANIDSVKRVALLEFIVAYFDLLESEKMIAVAKTEVNSLLSYLRDIRHLYEQGIVVKNDLLSAQVRLADAKQRLIAASSGREMALVRLNNILALPLRQKTKVSDTKMKPPDIPALEDAWQVALKQRPELHFYQDSIEASRLSARARAVENLPTVFADGGYSHMQNKFLVHQDNAFLSVGAKMNIYDGGSGRAQAARERARQRRLEEDKGKLSEDIKLEIEDSFLSLRDAREKVIVALGALAQAAENVRFYRARYAAGNATTTDVLEAIALEKSAQTNYYSSDYEVKRSYAKLMYSMGIDLVLLYETMEKKNEHTK